MFSSGGMTGYELMETDGGDTRALTITKRGMTRVGGGAGLSVVRSRLEPSTL
jgi:hypothetical protein